MNEKQNIPLEHLFRPKSIAMVGATERSTWSQLIYGNLVKFGYQGSVYLVNRRGVRTHGIETYTSCVAIGNSVDLAFVMVPVEGVMEALMDVGAAGIRFAVVLTSGFAETGGEGAELQRALVQQATKLGITLLGPNCLGFFNFRDHLYISALPVYLPLIPGRVALVSQSGATANVLGGFAHQQGIGLSYVIATGNEAQIGVDHILDFLVQDEGTDVIGVFLEAVRDADRFKRVAHEALERKKALVVLKVGRSPLAAQLARAHTGAVTGDDRIFDAICERYGIIRVDSCEDLIVTAGLIAHTGVLPPGGIAVASISGGACEVIADTAARVSLSLPQFSQKTYAALRRVMPSYGAIHNPLDVTGAAVTDPALFTRVLQLMAKDPEISFTACVYDLPRSADDLIDESTLGCIGEGLRAALPAGVLVNQMTRPITQFSRDLMIRLGVPMATGSADHFIRAFVKVAWWSEKCRVGVLPNNQAHGLSVKRSRPDSERTTLEYLASCGVPVVPTVLAMSRQAAVALADQFVDGAAMKIASPDILHKTEVGGVKLSLMGAASFGAAYDGILASVRSKRPDARIEGCLVAPMRRGLELFVGVTNNPLWGRALVLGLGGVWIEALNDTTVRMLPVDKTTVMTMLGELRGFRLLSGYRGMSPVNLDVLADVIVQIGHAGLSLGNDLEALEVNPLIATADKVEALDALAVWRKIPAHS